MLDMPTGLEAAMIEVSKGERSTLSPDELRLLEERVLPTARRWLGIYGLAEHGAKTLAYWGEDFEVPDHLQRQGFTK